MQFEWRNPAQVASSITDIDMDEDSGNGLLLSFRPSWVANGCSGSTGVGAARERRLRA